MTDLKILLASTSNPEINPRQVKLKAALESFGHHVGTYWANPPPKPRFLRQLIGLIETFRLSYALEDYDILHLVDGWDIGLLPFLVSDIPVVFDIRSLWPLVGRRRSNDAKTRFLSFLRGLVTRIIVRSSDHVATVDPRLAREITMMKPEGISFLRNLPSRTMFQGVPFNQNPETIDFAWFGSIDPNRRVGELLKAWCRFVEQTEEDCHLWIYGWPSAEREYYQQNIEPYYEEPTVHYIGRVPFPEVPRHYRKMDFIVAPNAGDHWQLKLGEALAAGVPLLLRYGPLHHKLVGNRGAVYFHSEERATDETEILNALHKAVDRLEDLKEEAREKEPPYWEEDIKRLIDVYRRLLEIEKR